MEAGGRLETFSAAFGTPQVCDRVSSNTGIKVSRVFLEDVNKSRVYHCQGVLELSGGESNMVKLLPLPILCSNHSFFGWCSIFSLKIDWILKINFHVGPIIRSSIVNNVDLIHEPYT